MENRILVVSKSPVVASMIQVVMAQHQTAHSASLESALNHLETQAQEPQLVIVEDRFVAHQGAALKVLALTYPHIPVLAMMSRLDRAWEQCLAHAGATACFYGSFTEDRKLKRTIAKMIGSKP
ncbi:MAG: hypothetical protein AB7F28_08095 [Candidatus Margulisiibacteriota bacterium]